MSKKIINRLLEGDIPLDFNWNTDSYSGINIPAAVPSEPTLKQAKNVQFVSEDLRDGLHGIAQYPKTEEMIAYVGALHRLGIQYMTIGIYPGEGTEIDYAIKNLLAQMRKKYPSVTPIVLTLASRVGIDWAVSCKAIHPKLTALIFMGSAPSRLLVEEWERKHILDTLAWAVQEAVSTHHIDVIGATEHTTQTPPDFLRDIIRTVVGNGAKYFCIADTIGIARPVGVARIVKFVAKVLKDMGASHVKIDWHGHDDLGNGTANALTAIASGAHRVHTVARGIGERAGNTRMESVLLNCAQIIKEAGHKVPWKTRYLTDVLTKYDMITQIPVPNHGPLGKRAFSTSLGIHTAAMLKAALLVRASKRLKEHDLALHLELMARTIYSAIDPHEVGRKHEIHVGPWSGKSTVKLAYIQMEDKSVAISDELLESILTTAKKLGRELSSEELAKLIKTKR